MTKLNKLDDYPDILKPEDLVRLLGFSINSIYRMLDNGEIPGVRMGGHWRILKTKLVGLFESQGLERSGQSETKRSVEEAAIGAYVKKEMQDLLNRDLLSDNEIDNLRSIEYCRDIFGIYFAVIKDYDRSIPISEQIKVGKYNRYWKTVFADRYLVCSQWHKGHREKFLVWATHVRTSKN